jgi:hypothetical protein
MQSSPSPVEVPDLPTPVVQLAAGSVFTCALTKDGEVSCWGNGQNGRFGDIPPNIDRMPVELKELDGPILSLAAGDYHICARTMSAELYCWGGISSDQDFDPQDPFVVKGLTEGFVDIAAGGGHTCVLTAAGAVKCWGDNYYGQLGTGTDLGSWDPIIAMDLTEGALRIASGSGHVCALLENGGVLCWGDCSNGQCGDRSISWDWSSYTNQKYHFSIDYPTGWTVLEVPTADYPSEVDQVWFAKSSFPPAGTGARAEISLVITTEDPSSNWASPFFDNYESMIVPLGNIQGKKISGTNKESQADEIVIIIKAKDYFIQALPNHSPDSLRYFDEMMSTFNLDF